MPPGSLLFHTFSSLRNPSLVWMSEMEKAIDSVQKVSRLHSGKRKYSGKNELKVCVSTTLSALPPRLVRPSGSILSEFPSRTASKLLALFPLFHWSPFRLRLSEGKGRRRAGPGLDYREAEAALPHCTSPESSLGCRCSIMRCILIPDDTPEQLLTPGTAKTTRQLSRIASYTWHLPPTCLPMETTTLYPFFLARKDQSRYFFGQTL